MRKTKLWLLPIAIVALALVMAGCTKDGDPVKGNVAPDTRILSYVISSAAELDTLGNPTTKYSVTVYWAGSDIDGTVKSFAYSGDAITAGETINSQRTFVYDFADAATEYTLQVRARDNLNALDQTPAEITIMRNEGGVETVILDGPPHGAEVSPGVTYKVGASSTTGSISAIQYRVNDGSWTSVAVDENNEAVIDFTGLPVGSTTLSFKGVRDDGVEDLTPASISLLVRSGKYLPVLESTSPVVDGGGWFEGVGLTFSWKVTTSHYYGAIQAEGYSWAVGPDLAVPDNYNLDPEAALESGWSSATSADYQPTAGSHVFYLKCRDTGGGVDTLRIRFGAAQFLPDKGILVVNGVDPGTYGTEITDHIDIGSYWNGFSVDFWDLFGDEHNPDPAFTLPASATYVGGGAQLSPDLMAQYRTILWLGNEYQGDEVYYFLTPVYPYLQAGGNFFLATRYTADFIDDNLAEYAQIYWREGAANGATAGISLSEAKSIFPGLADLSPFNGGSSLADVFTSSIFNSGGSISDDDVTNWDGVRCFTDETGTCTMIYANRSSAVVGSFGYVRGVGVWAHPNLVFAELAVPEYPVLGEDSGKGNFILICGRNYRHNFDNTALAFPYVMEKMCAEPK